MTNDYKNKINSMLNEFKSHGLEDLKKAELMNRVDTKFVVPLHLLNEILTKIRSEFTILQINNKRLFDYKNIYYDTKDYQFYRNHHNGKLNRFKVRYRHYVDSDLSFLEVKFKDNKKRTYKRRIKSEKDPENVILHSKDFLLEAGIINYKNLVIVQRSGYQRVALANEENAERLTIDMNLYFGHPNMPHHQKLGHQVIFELKQEKLNRNSKFYLLMKELGIKPSSFSKYCIGLALTDEKNELKVNNFLKVMKKIQVSQESIV